MLCDTCIEEWYQTGTKCERCSGSLKKTIFGLIIAGIIGIILVCVVVRFNHYVTENFPLLISAIFNTGRFKIVFTTLQIVGSVSRATGIVWPEPFASMVAFYEYADFNFFDILPVGCYSHGINFYDNLLASTLVPFAIILLIIVLCTVGPKGVGPKKGIMRRSTGEKIVLFVAYCILPTVSLQLGKTFACTEFPDKSRWLSADLTLQCTSTNGSRSLTWTVMQVYALLMIFIYPLGIPFVFYYLLDRSKKLIHDHYMQVGKHEMHKTIRPLKFLFDRYRLRYYNYEVVDCLRRVWFCLGIVLLESFLLACKAVIHRDVVGPDSHPCVPVRKAFSARGQLERTRDGCQCNHSLHIHYGLNTGLRTIR